MDGSPGRKRLKKSSRTSPDVPRSVGGTLGAVGKRQGPSMLLQSHSRRSIAITLPGDCCPVPLKSWMGHQPKQVMEQLARAQQRDRVCGNGGQVCLKGAEKHPEGLSRAEAGSQSCRTLNATFLHDLFCSDLSHGHLSL